MAARRLSVEFGAAFFKLFYDFPETEALESPHLNTYNQRIIEFFGNLGE